MKRLIFWLMGGLLVMTGAGGVKAADYNYSSSYSYTEIQNGKVIKKVVTTVVPGRKSVDTYGGNYVINDFRSEITLNQNTSMRVKETIEAEYFVPKHGIFRVIPDIYSSHGKTIRGEISNLSIKDEKEMSVPFTIDRLNQSLSIKIGDPKVTVLGKKTYVLEYTVADVVLDYGAGPEIYWNITGGEWDTIIKKAEAKVESPFGNIEKVECYAGITGTQDQYCKKNFEGKGAEFQAENALGQGKDFTVVVQIAKDNRLVFPGVVARSTKTTRDNWGYILAVMPLVFMVVSWLLWGRDKKYTSANLYYKPERPREETVSLWARPHLPTVYGPIDTLTPSEMGTIADEKVDLKDIVAEIAELGRLGYLKIEKLGKNDYKITGEGKDATNLPEHQQYLLESIFDSKKETKKEIVVDGKVTEDKTEIQYSGEVKISDLEEKFYEHLEPFRKKVYKRLIGKGAIERDPRIVWGSWLVWSILLNAISFTAALVFTVQNFNGGPLGIWGLLMIPSLVLARFMSKRSAWGYSLYRQTVGLKYYVSKGKWREEIHEKNLFLEEILPLAIALGVVKKLAADMKGLGLAPPSYFEGSDMTHFERDIWRFHQTSFAAMTSVPYTASSRSYNSGWSGRSSWSHGSGFSHGGGGFSGGGGHSGGGFGGGGGGSW